MEFTIVAGPFGGVAEGPAWDGQHLLFTHIPASRILSFDPGTGLTSIHREDTNWCNGTMFDAEGRYYGCEGGARRVVRYDADEAVALTEDFEGNKYNIPNDLAIDPQGRTWFTDPWYEGAGGDWSEDRKPMELDHESVYRIDPVGDGSYGPAQRVTFDTTRPNGLLFNLDHSVLYIAQSGRNLDEKRQLRAYAVKDDGSLAEPDLLHEFGDWRGIDGMVLDTEGNIWATAGTAAGGPGSSVYVFSQDGEVIERHQLPVEEPTNCTFAGPGLSELYVTTIGGYLLWGQTEATGRLWFPAA